MQGSQGASREHRSLPGNITRSTRSETREHLLTSLPTTRIFLRWRLGFWGSLVSSALIRFLTRSAAYKNKTQCQRQYIKGEWGRGSQLWLPMNTSWEILKTPRPPSQPQRFRVNWPWAGPGFSITSEPHWRSFQEHYSSQSWHCRFVHESVKSSCPLGHPQAGPGATCHGAHITAHQAGSKPPGLAQEQMVRAGPWPQTPAPF